MGTPSFRNSPVQNWRKFSAVLGTTSANSSILTRPTFCPPMEMSKKTTGLVEGLLEEEPASAAILGVPRMRRGHQSESAKVDSNWAGTLEREDSSEGGS